MTAAVRAAVIGPRPLVRQPSPHCTAPGCTRTDTATVDGVCGRRCSDHPPTFDPGHAVHLMVSGWPEDAFAYCRAPLP